MAKRMSDSKDGSSEHNSKSKESMDLKFANIQIMIMTKRLQMLSDDEAKRIEKMN